MSNEAFEKEWGCTPCTAIYSKEEKDIANLFFLKGRNSMRDYSAQEANKLLAEIGELKAKLKAETSRKYINELKTHINDLREALEEIHRDSQVDSWQCKLAEQALTKTPAQSLQAFENEVIERVAYAFNDEADAVRIMNKIRALKKEVE